MTLQLRRILFALFFISGFCGLLYQTVWLRLAFATFGIITPVLSVVISVFMLGLSLGSWAGGKWIGTLTQKTKSSAILYYGLAELFIAIGSITVPWLFEASGRWLLGVGESDSARYLLYSAIALSLSILPWCICMGVTFPFMMAYIKERTTTQSKSFSFLYLANVIGAMTGVLITALVLIELLGFRHTLWVAGVSNFLIAVVSFGLGISVREKDVVEELPTDEPKRSEPTEVVSERLLLWLLFTTGFSSMAMEVVWTRAFATVLSTQVYAFAALLFVYLLATWVGSLLYRKNIVSGQVQKLSSLVVFITVSAFLPLLINDPRLTPRVVWTFGNLQAFPALMSIFPFCAFLGYLTPKLIDDYAAGAPDRAGTAYAVNVVGCILGPLVSGYLLLSWIGVQGTLIILAVPFLLFLGWSFQFLNQSWRMYTSTVIGICLVCSLFVVQTYENPFQSDPDMPQQVKRDHLATVLSAGEGLSRKLFMNGVGITSLTPITKFMAHLPMAFHPGKPESVLTICFGMGTTHRSMLSWGGKATTVELSPAVRDSFGFFFTDAPAVLSNPKGNVIIDDGRRFLNRTNEHYDVITIDPPPPAAAAGSSLLYSEEFYQSLKKHLKPNGIVQQWYFGGEPMTINAVARSLANTFPYVRAFPSIENGVGCHFIASMSPIPTMTASELLAKLPGNAKKDLIEWFQPEITDKQVEATFNFMLKNEIPITKLVDPNPEVRITDDRPFNEYYFLRVMRNPQ